MSTLNTILPLPLPANRTQASAPVATAATEGARAYHEFPGLKHETKDVLKQLEGNIALLEDLGGRLSFVLAEVRSLMRR